MMASAILVCSRLPGASVTVKVLNGWSGKPFANVDVTLTEANGEVGTGLPTSSILRRTKLRTKQDGSVTFLIGKPLPPRILFDVFALRGCMPTKAYMKRNNWKFPVSQWNPEEILRNGYREVDACLLGVAHPKFDWQAVTAAPGEVVLFALPAPRAQW
jgi:hypothetical protein